MVYNELMPYTRPAEQPYVLRSLIMRPNFHYASQERNEIVHLIVRAHPFTQIGWIISIVLLALVPLIFSPLLTGLPLLPSQIIFFIIAWYAVLFSAAITNFFLWYFNLGIVTSNKLVDVDTHGILFSESSTAFLTQIEEISDSSRGIFSAVFNYGNVFVQTAGEEPNIEFTNTPRPSFVVRLINSLIKTGNVTP